MLAAVLITPKKNLKNDQEEEMFLKGKSYSLTLTDKRFVTTDEQGLKNIMSVGYIDANFIVRI